MRRSANTGVGIVNLLASLSYLGNGNVCTSNWFFSGSNVTTGAHIGWGVGNLTSGKWGAASYDWVEYQYQIPGNSTWTTIKRFYPGTDPDPRTTPYEWNSPAFPINVQVVSSSSQAVLGVTTPTGLFAPPPTDYVYTTIQTNASGTANITGAGNLTVSGTGYVNQPSRNTTPLPSVACITYSNVTTGTTVSGLANAFSTINNVSFNFSLDANNKYESQVTVLGYTRIVTSGTDPVGSASGTDSAGTAVSCNLYRSAGVGSPSGICTGLSGSYLTGYAVAVGRYRYAKNPDTYGIGDYVDLVYTAVDVTDTIEYQDTSTGTAHYSTLNPMVYLTDTWSPGYTGGVPNNPPTSPPTITGSLTFDGKLNPSGNRPSAGSGVDYTVQFV